MRRAALAASLALLVLASCHKSEAPVAKASGSSKPLLIGGYSVQALPGWMDATTELRKSMETQDEAVNASLPLQSHFQRAFRGSAGEVYVFSILDKPWVALEGDMVDGHLSELSARFNKRAPDSKPRSTSSETADGKIWSWSAEISGQLYYKTIYWNRSYLKAVEVDLIASKSMAAESLSRYAALCGSLQ